MADPLGGIKKYVKDWKTNVGSGVAESKSLGKELSEKRQNVDAAKQSLSSGSSAASKVSGKSTPSSKDLVNPSGAPYGSRPGEKPPSEVLKDIKPLGSMKKGGPVKKTGVYQLHKGEQVVPARAASALGKKKVAKKGSGKIPHRMVTEQMDDGSFQITHEHKPSSDPAQPSQPPEKFTAANAKHLVRHVKQTYGQQDDGMAFPSSYEMGGTVQKGGMAQVHAGETVLPAVKNPDIYIGGLGGSKAKAVPNAPASDLSRNKILKAVPTAPVRQGPKKLQPAVGDMRRQTVLT